MTKAKGKAVVRLASASAVEVTRAFDAPRDLVYRAHTTPALLQRWQLGPPGWSMPVCEMDVRVGGTYRWRWRSDADGKEFGFHGAFTEVEPPGRLAYTEFFDPGDVGGDMGDGALITTTFEEEDGVTILTILMDFKTGKARDAALATGMTDGMEQSYLLLDELLAGRPDRSGSRPTTPPAG